MKLPKKIWRLLFYLVIFSLFILYHLDKILTKLDQFIMPVNDEICRTFPHSLTKRKLDISENSNRTLITVEKKLRKISILNDKLNNGKFKGNENNPDRIAIIIPYRDRDTNLNIFLEYMHQFLSEQQTNYGIYIIQPIDEISFNRAQLINIGYKEALKDGDWNCMIFHDIDLLPENDQNIYRCDNFYPKQLAISISVYNYVVTGYFKDKYFGGVNAFTPKQFEAINGFSNSYFDWGVEDDDALLRVMKNFSSIKRLSPEIGRYFANCHNKQKKNPNRFFLYVSAKSRMTSDGLNSLDYSVKSRESTFLFTRVYVSYKDNK